MAWAVPAFDLQSFCTTDSGLTAREGPRLQTHAGTILSFPLGELFFPCSEKVCSLSGLCFDIAGCLVRDGGQF